MRHTKKKKEPIKLSIGDIQNCPEGFTNIASLPVRSEYKDNSVAEVHSHYFLQRLPGKARGPFMDELYRIMVPGAQAKFIVPYYSSMRAIMDYRYEWPPVCEMSFLYFNKGWRESQKILGPICDFDFTYGYFDAPETSTRMQDVQVQRRTNYLNAVLDLQAVLVKRP